MSLELSTIFNHDTRSHDVSYNARIGLNFHLLNRGHVAAHFPANGDVLRLNIRKNDAGRFDDQVLLECDFPFNTALDNEVFLTVELTLGNFPGNEVGIDFARLSVVPHPGGGLLFVIAAMPRRRRRC